MRVKLIKIGNSYGVRLPKPIIQECQIGTDIDLTVFQNKIILSAHHLPRSSWQELMDESQRETGEKWEW